MKLQKDLYIPTTRSDSLTPNSTIELKTTATGRSAEILVFTPSIIEDKPKAGFVSMTDFLSEIESDPVASDLNEGRKWVAETFYKESRSLAALRLSKGWSQKQLAEMLNTKQPYIARIENGVEDIQLSTLKKLAKVFDVDIHEIIEAFAD